MRPRVHDWDLAGGRSTLTLDVTGAPVTSFKSATTVVLLGALGGAFTSSCSTDREVARIAVPDTNVTLVLAEDEKQMFRYETIVNSKPALEQGFLGPHDADSSLRPLVTREGNVITFSWHGSLIRHFVKFDVATCRLVGDSHERQPAKIPGCKSHTMDAHVTSNNRWSGPWTLGTEAKASASASHADAGRPERLRAAAQL
jgi:hypothetical protein